MLFFYRTLADAFSKHVYSISCGVFLAYFNFGSDVIHSAASIFITWLVLKLIPNRTVSAAIVFFGNMAHLLTCYFLYSSEGYDLDFTTAQCVLTLRLISLGFDYLDGSKPNAQSDQKLNGLKELPSLLEVFGFGYFFGSFLTGPQFTFRHYKDFVTLDLFKKPGLEKSGTLPPLPVNYTLRCIGLGVLYLLLNAVGDIFFSPYLIIKPSFMEYSFFYRLFYATMSMKITLWKYLGVWLLAEGACVLSGIGFKEYKDSEIVWNGLSNVNPWLFETTPTLRGIVESFNINTNDWVKRYIFKRLIFLNNKTLSSFGALFFLAIWHGFAIGYFTCFLLEFLDMEVENRYRDLGWWTAFEKKFPFLTIPLYVVAWIIRNIVLSYGLLSFVFKTWNTSLTAYSSLYFLNHIFVVALLLAYPIIKKTFFPKKKQETSTKKD